MSTDRIKDLKESTNAIVIALLANVLISAVKFVGYFFTLSPSMLAESLHSVADSFNQILLFLGVRSASFTASKMHPWGTGIRQYLFNLFSAVGVFVVGCVVTLIHAVHSLMNPEHAVNEKSLTIAICILVLSLTIEGYSFYRALRATLKKMKRNNQKAFLTYIKNTDDSSLLAILLEDGVAVGGVFIALIGLSLSKYWDSTIPDAISAFIIGTILGVISFFLFKNNLAFIIGRSTDAEKEAEIREFILSLNSVDQVIDLKTEILGPNRVHLTVELDLDNSALIDIKQIRRDAQTIKEDPSKLYETLFDNWIRGGRTVPRELASIEHKVKERFKEIEVAHFEAVGGDHFYNFELLKVDFKVTGKDFNHVGMVKIKGKISAEKVLKVLLDMNLIEEGINHVVNIDLDEGIVDVFAGDVHLFQLRD